MLPRQIPDEPAVHRAAQKLTVLRSGPCTGHVIQNPRDFGSGKISVDQQAGFLTDIIADAGLFQPFTLLSGAAALPDDGVHHRLSGGLFPDDGSFPLVGDANGGNLSGGKPGLFPGACQRHQLSAQNVHGVVLHPTGLGIVLGQGILSLADDGALFVENDGTGAGGALVESDNIITHSLDLRLI